MRDGAVLVQELDFSNIYSRYEQVARLNFDHLVVAHQINFYFPVDKDEPRIEVSGVGDFLLSERSYKQLASRMGMTGSYFQKVDKEEQTQHFNMWLSQSDKKLLLRTANERVRAVLPEDYAVKDNEEILAGIRPMLESGDLQMVLFSEHDGRVFARFRFPQDLSGCGDPIFGGFNLVNSEVGTGKFCMDYLLYRDVCANGMIHRVDGASVLEQEHLYLDRAAFEARFSQAIDQVRAHQDGMAALFEDSRNFKLTETELRALFQEVRSHKLLPKKLLEKVEAKGLEENNWFSLVNAVTYAAQEFRIDRRFAIEVVAGDLLQRAAAFS